MRHAHEDGRARGLNDHTVSVGQIKISTGWTSQSVPRRDALALRMLKVSHVILEGNRKAVETERGKSEGTGQDGTGVANKHSENDR
jgi:hypothetical protein